MSISSIGIHEVRKVRARSFSPKNSNSVTIAIHHVPICSAVVEVQEITLFGLPKEKASELFYAMGGHVDEVVK